MKTLKVEYDVYYKLGSNLIKLNLTLCRKSKISISIPIVITENLDKFNSSSGYYNDICYTTTSEDGTDIILRDRQNEFISNNKIICQEDCVFSEYNSDNNIAKCTCKVKESSKSMENLLRAIALALAVPLPVPAGVPLPAPAGVPLPEQNN